MGYPNDGLDHFKQLFDGYKMVPHFDYYLEGFWTPTSS